MNVTYSYDDEQLGEVDATLSITMPIRDWEELADNMPDKWPGWKVRGAIHSVVRKARDRHFGEINQA